MYLHRAGDCEQLIGTESAGGGGENGRNKLFGGPPEVEAFQATT
jgi:hypothetical protein